jgi:hypothetical protein
VENCYVLDVGELARKGAFVPWHYGSVRWLRGEEVIASIGYTVRPAGDGLFLQLSYRSTRAGEEMGVNIHLDTTALHFGGRRWWGICPLVMNGQACNRRVGKLYLPPGGRYFRCRICYRLTYRGAQEHDKRVDALRRNPAELYGILADPAAYLRNRRVLLAIKALGP